MDALAPNAPHTVDHVIVGTLPRKGRARVQSRTLLSTNEIK